jgi:hypothetical protein
VSLERRDFSLAALFLWIKLTLTALSRAENADDRLVASGMRLACLMTLRIAVSLVLLRAVLVLSFRTFLIADFISGIILVCGWWVMARGFVPRATPYTPRAILTQARA